LATTPGGSAQDDEDTVRTVRTNRNTALHGQHQGRIIELLREVHLIAFKEIERLHLRIKELENENRPHIEKLITKPTASSPATVNPPSQSNQSEMLNEMQVAKYLKMSVAALRKWRMFRTGPNFVKIGSAVRYKRGDIETWLSSRPGLR
jgi:predicted DNA-binding transcriptional regulator AlpA